MFGAHGIVPIDENTSWLIVRGQSGPASLVTTMVVDPVVFTRKGACLLLLVALGAMIAARS